MAITFIRRSRVNPGRWLWPETVELPEVGARRFLRDARRSRSHRIIMVRRCRSWVSWERMPVANGGIASAADKFRITRKTVWYALQKYEGYANTILGNEVKQ